MPALADAVTYKTVHYSDVITNTISNHQRLECILNRLFRPTSKKMTKLYVTALCEGNSAVTGEFPSQMASNAENVSIWWRHNVFSLAHVRMPGQRVYSKHAIITYLLCVYMKCQQTHKNICNLKFIIPLFRHCTNKVNYMFNNGDAKYSTPQFNIWYVIS